MRNWKNWLFPLLTCLTVAGLALLPLRLSLLEDGRQTGVVHSEELAEDSNFPARPPDLPGRVWLLTQMESIPEGLTIMERELKDDALEEAASLARAELQRLETAGILPERTAVRLGDVSGYRIYLRDQSDLSSASFLEVRFYSDPGKTSELFWLYLDLESGRALAVEVISPALPGSLSWTEDLGRAFLDGLDLESTLVSSGNVAGKEIRESVFRLEDSRIHYTIRSFQGGLDILPDVNWEALDQLAQEGKTDDPMVRAALGYDS